MFLKRQREEYRRGIETARREAKLAREAERMGAGYPASTSNCIATSVYGVRPVYGTSSLTSYVVDNPHYGTASLTEISTHIYPSVTHTHTYTFITNLSIGLPVLNGQTPKPGMRVLYKGSLVTVERIEIEEDYAVIVAIDSEPFRDGVMCLADRELRIPACDVIMVAKEVLDYLARKEVEDAA